MQIPLSMVADVRIVEGPAMIKSENGMLRSYVQLNVRDRDIVGFVEEAQREVAQKVKLPQGMNLEWSGQFEHQVRAKKTLQVIFPAVILLIFIILYLTYNDLMDAVLMMMAVPEALVGGIFLLWLTSSIPGAAANQLQRRRVGGLHRLLRHGHRNRHHHAGLSPRSDRATGRAGENRLARRAAAGGRHRRSPSPASQAADRRRGHRGVAPMLWVSGVGHEIILPMAAPVLGGLLVSDEVVDIFIPVRFYWLRRRRWLKLHPPIAS